jgi:hypothetical protein
VRGHDRCVALDRCGWQAKRPRRPPRERGRGVVLQAAVIQRQAHRFLRARARPIESGPGRRDPQPGDQEHAHEESHPHPDETWPRRAHDRGRMPGPLGSEGTSVQVGGSSPGGVGALVDVTNSLNMTYEACARPQHREIGMSTPPCSSAESVEVPSPTCAPRAACPRCRRSCHDRR